MFALIIIALLALFLFGLVAAPLIFPDQADPLPDDRDPVQVDLEEERDALLRAIRELDARKDLTPERRAQLEARYEAKAAKVLRALEERTAAPVKKRPAPAPGRRRRVPYAALTLLGLAVVTAAALGGWVLPRVGDTSVTAFFESDLQSARELRDLQQAAERDPSTANLAALGDAYWRLDDAPGARETYERVVERPDAPALALRRLGFLVLQEDLGQALGYLERARSIDPADLDTLYALGEIYFALADPAAAAEAWEALLAAPGGAGDPQTTARLELARTIAPLLERVAEDPSQENLHSLAEALWSGQEQQRAVEVYFRVLTEHDPNDPVALGRVGQLLFTSGRLDDAIALLERSAQVAGPDAEPETLLFLGNAHYSAEQYEQAISAWEAYVARVGGPEQAGRVPDLIRTAQANLAGGAEVAELPGAAAGAGGQTGPGDPLGGGGADQAGTDRAEAGDAGVGVAQAGEAGAGDQPGIQLAGAPAGGDLFAANCAVCHGPQGQGGAGPRLAGSARAADAANVRSAIRFGRGMMPGFAATLTADEIEALVDHVATLAAGTAGR